MDTTTTTDDAIRTARKYEVEIRDECGSRELVAIQVAAGTEADQDAAAMACAKSECEDWIAEGDWGDNGRAVSASYTLSDDDSEWPEEWVEVEIEPNHSELIRGAEGMPQRESCGREPEDHSWTGDGEGETWGGTGTSIAIATHCRACGLHRVECQTGSQRNSGERDTYTYRWLDQEEIDCHLAAGDMDAESA